jgi:hypothetical protein
MYNFLPKKLSLSSQTYGFGIRDPGSEIREKPIPDLGSRGQKGTGSGSATLVADTDPESGAFLTLGSGMGKKSGSGSGMNNPDHISESLETILWVKILRRIRDQKWKKFGSGVEKIRIRDPG